MNFQRIKLSASDYLIKIQLKHLYLLFLLLALLNAVRFRKWSYALDDSWISFRIARNLIEHGILTYDISRPPVEGMTNLLWTLCSASWIYFLPEIDPILPARLLGLLLFLISLVLICRLSATVASQLKGNPIAAAGITGLIIVSSGSMAYYSLSGLETALWGLLFIFFLHSLYNTIQGGIFSSTLTGICLGLLGLTRPEGVAIGICSIMILFLWPSKRHISIKVAIPFCIIIFLMELFRFGTYGQLIPNTYYAKPPDVELGILYFYRFLKFGLGIIGLLFIVTAIFLSPFTRIVAFLSIISIIGTIWSGGDWMVGYRRVTLEMFGIAMFAGVAIGTIRKKKWQMMLIMTACAVIASNIFCAVSGKDSQFYDTQIFAKLGYLADQTECIKQVALNDIGRFGWYFKGSIFDLAGLTDDHIAQLKSTKGGKQWDDDYFRKHGPDLVIVPLIHPRIENSSITGFQTRDCDQGIMNSILTKGGYRLHSIEPYSRKAILGVFCRNNLTLPADLWKEPTKLAIHLLDR